MSSTNEVAGNSLFAVLGSPVGHSLSPLLHNTGFAAAGLVSYSYRAIECDAETLPGLVGSLGPQWTGLSVTMPGKSAAAAFASRRSSRVDLLGVANTLVRDGSGWFAENTDVDGVIGALHSHGIDRPGSVLLLGGGGTALSVVAALAELGSASISVAGRRPESRAAALDLARRTGLVASGCEFSPAAVAAAAAGVDLVVSTVPAGVADPLADSLAGVPALFDVVYHPWPTPLAAAGPAERVTITGLDMLLHQALQQFRLFTGMPAPAAAMRDALLAEVGGGIALPLGANDQS